VTETLDLLATTSECFISIEGEAMYTGTPTAYVRFVGCNFQCRGFNNPNNLEITNDVLGFNPAAYTKLEDLPPITISCDSIYSWDTRFSHLWKTQTIDELVKELINLLPHNSWRHPITEQDYIFSITGGEPTLRYKQIIALLSHPDMQKLRILLIETNGSVPLHPKLLTFLQKWTEANPLRKIVWSNSPKLSASGESWYKAIRPDVIASQWNSSYHASQIEQYFKFVCGDNDTHFEEVKSVLNAYSSADIPIRNNAYIMPMACVEEQQKEITTNVALRCIQEGYIYCHRTHLEIFGNAIGT
jgi:7-carboxy-7-deazaguanine synthase